VVRLGWAGAGSADAPSAILVVNTSGHHVAEAHVWPPVEREIMVPSRSLSSAWADVQSGRAPIGVEDVMGLPAWAGIGTLQKASLTEVLTQDQAGRLYLVPAYRFSGTVTINGLPGRRIWYAIVPVV